MARTEGERTIQLRAFASAGGLRVEVTNTTGGSSDAPGSGKSLEIIRQRLELAYGDRATVDHGPFEDHYQSTLQIPMETR